MNIDCSPRDIRPPLSWWRVCMGPAIVAVAGIVTAVIAARGADSGLRVDASAAVTETPTIQARNHALTVSRNR